MALRMEKPDGGNDSAGEPRKSAKAGKPLPTPRISLAKQLDLLRAYGTAYVARGVPIKTTEASDLVDVHQDTGRLANSFFVDVGLLAKSIIGFTPHPDVVAYHRATEFGASDASHRLQPVLRDSWFAKALATRLSFRGALDETEALTILADAANATLEHRPQLILLLGFLEAANIITRDGGVIRAVRQAEPERIPDVIVATTRPAVGDAVTQEARESPPQTQMRMVDLPRVQGTLTLTGNFNFMALKGEERTLVYALIDLMDKFEDKQALSDAAKPGEPPV